VSEMRRVKLLKALHIKTLVHSEGQPDCVNLWALPVKMTEIIHEMESHYGIREIGVSN
jgi:hypothetical protein